MITLTPEQQAVADKLVEFCTSESDKTEYMALCAPAGCGKTTTIGAVIEGIRAVKQMLDTLLPEEEKPKNSILSNKIILSATTNKAAAELSSKAPIHASTIHSVLGLTLKPDFNTGVDRIIDNSRNVLKNCVVFIDESSMIDGTLLKFIETKMNRSKVVFIMDEKQLLAVGAKGVPALQKAGANILTLSNIMRQNSDSHIIKVGSMLRKAIDGHPLTTHLPDGKDIVACTDEEFKEQVDRVFTNPDYKLTDGRILCWTNSMVHKYNRYVRKLRYGSDEPRKFETLITRKPILSNSNKYVHFVEEVVKVLDIEETEFNQVEAYDITLLNSHAKVLQPKNPDVVKALLKDAAARCKASGNWQQYYMIRDTFADLRPVYAGTVHTSQGSTYDEVFIDIGDLSKCKKREELLRLLYVAFTRARTKVWLRGYE